jgi:hypothetical protein
MRVNSINNQPNFQAKLIILDTRVDKFINEAYYRNGAKTRELMAKLGSIHPDTSLGIRLSGFEDDARLIIKNLSNQETEVYNLDAMNVVTKNDEKAFTNLIERLLDDGREKTKVFWG